MKTAKTTATMTTKAKVEPAAGQDYRVYYLSKQLRLSAKATRESQGVTQAQFTQAAVAKHLDSIVTGLAALGIVAQKNIGPRRLPVSDSLLKALPEASASSSVPQSILLAACLQLHSVQTKATKSRKAVK